MADFMEILNLMKQQKKGVQNEEKRLFPSGMDLSKPFTPEQEQYLEKNKQLGEISLGLGGLKKIFSRAPKVVGGVMRKPGVYNQLEEGGTKVINTLKPEQMEAVGGIPTSGRSWKEITDAARKIRGVGKEWGQEFSNIAESPIKRNLMKRLGIGLGSLGVVGGVGALINKEIDSAGQNDADNPYKAVAETVAPANVVTPAAVVTPEKNVDQYNGDIYTALRDPNGLSDKQFKAFVDTHGGSLPGIGYVEDPKTGKITRVAEKPSAQEMTIDQADAQARMITANAHKLAGVEAGKERKAIADDKIAAQKRDQFAKALAISSPKETDPTTGIVTGVNEEVGLFDLINRKHPIHEDYKPAVEALNEKYKSFEAAVYALPKNKGKKPNKAQVDSMFRQGLLERKI